MLTSIDSISNFYLCFDNYGIVDFSWKYGVRHASSIYKSLLTYQISSLPTSDYLVFT